MVPTYHYFLYTNCHLYNVYQSIKNYAVLNVNSEMISFVALSQNSFQSPQPGREHIGHYYYFLILFLKTTGFHSHYSLGAHKVIFSLLCNSSLLASLLQWVRPKRQTSCFRWQGVSNMQVPRSNYWSNPKG